MKNYCLMNSLATWAFITLETSIIISLWILNFIPFSISQTIKLKWILGRKKRIHGRHYKIIAHFFLSPIRSDYFVKDRERSGRVGTLLPAERRMGPFGMTSELDFWRCNLKQSFGKWNATRLLIEIVEFFVQRFSGTLVFFFSETLEVTVLNANVDLFFFYWAGLETLLLCLKD